MGGEAGCCGPLPRLLRYWPVRCVYADEVEEALFHSSHPGHSGVSGCVPGAEFRRDRPGRLGLIPAGVCCALVLAFAFGVALPILHRTLFVSRTRGRKHVTAEELLRFEELNLRIAMVAPYLALAAYVLGIPRFHFFGTVIASLYAVYYFYPSDKRDRFERKVFRVE